jgi:CheY-like chemotaxis protein
VFSILIIEDDTCTAYALAKLCRSGGYVAELAGTGAAALQQLQLSSFDLIILDYMLPDMTGMDVLRQMRAGGDAHPIIIYTALSEPGLRESFKHAGATDFWLKTEMTSPQILSSLESQLQPHPALISTSPLSSAASESTYHA